VNTLALALDVLEACSGANTPGGLAVAAATGLARHFPLSRVALQYRDRIWVGRPGEDLSTEQSARLASRHSTEFTVRDAVFTVATREQLPAPAIEALRVVLSSALERLELVTRLAELSRRAHSDSNELRHQLGTTRPPADVVAASPAMRALVEQTLPLVARHDTSVLILGETGTGKEVVARLIHGLSRRAHRPLLTVNCGAIPETLIESVLFGHTRGAFTGATADHAGLFERADGATLLLDEIGDLPKTAQVKLLRVLQGGEVTRLGAQTTQRVDVRLIAATHRSLESMVDAGTFREDLFYRLNVFPITVPPLRERPEDVAQLALKFISRLSEKMNRPVPHLSASALSRLQRYRWPGNVRELHNVIERSLLTSDGASLSLPVGFEREAVLPRGPASWKQASRQTIEEALRASEGRVYGKRGAAVLLGLKPTTLQSKMKKLGVHPHPRK
jgi:formate hydrogenlyase transcriptional activator